MKILALAKIWVMLTCVSDTRKFSAKAKKKSTGTLHSIVSGFLECHDLSTDDVFNSRILCSFSRYSHDTTLHGPEPQTPRSAEYNVYSL